MLQIAQRIGDFEVLRLLGRGGMGVVYEAQQLNPPRRVALKVLSPWLAEDEEALARFEREARVAAQLDHPGIVRIITNGRAEGVAYYTMQLVRGVSLAGLMRAAAESQPSTVAGQPTPGPSPRVPPEDAPTETPPPAAPGQAPAAAVREYRTDRYRLTARVGRDAARALAHAHRQGYLHRDVKPSNLMIDEEGHVYLVDFGLTRALEPGGDASRLGVVRGTPWYMSPEQARAEALDARSDLYSLGITLYELATGGLGPFTAARDNRDEILAQVRAGSHLPPRVLAPDIPAELERIILRCIEARPRRRYQTGEELAADLERFLQTTRPDRPAGPAPARPRRRLRSAVLAGGAALLLAGGALGLVYFPRPGAPTEKPPVTQKPRPLNVPYALFDKDFQPVHGEPLAGKGLYHLLRGEGLVFDSLRDPNATLFALDAPQSDDFEFSVELRRHTGKKPGLTAEAGVFFGWRQDPAKTAAPPRFFVVSINDPPDAKKAPALAIRSCLLRERQDPRGAVYSPRPLWGLKNKPLDRPDDWHRLRVLARPSRVTVYLGHDLTWEGDLVSLRRLDQANSDLRPRGKLGLWLRNSAAAFRDASVTPLPAEEK